MTGREASAYAARACPQANTDELKRVAKIIERTAKIVFWDLMPYDFDIKLSASKILSIMKRNLRQGSIIVLHDNPRSKAPQVLGDFIDFAHNNGYEFMTLNDTLVHDLNL